ncbi:AAA family ATPase [Staphylococcus shinii]|nr:AAA family ATPase [Staphylococcus shinii]MDW8566854.1 AAA family ATPase [Staphylococcus shinii]
MLFETEKFDTVIDTEVGFPKYNSNQFLNEVFMNEKYYHSLVELIKIKKNVILQGPPGVGKTYAAKRLAYSIIGEKATSRVKMIQFHQSYSYEDFIMGFRPTETGFKLNKGTFYNFCKQAEEDSENKYFFIIDEINRGNLSKIFGELFMLIENDKRGTELELLYADEKFSVPKNVYIIGMMNTADRSLAILDYALRRRFAFYNMNTSFTTMGFREYQENLQNSKFDELILCVQNLNKEIINDETLGEGFVIGHSYFCNLKEITDSILTNIVEFEIIPLIKEYWFDEETKVDIWSEMLRSSIK